MQQQVLNQGAVELKKIQKQRVINLVTLNNYTLRTLLRTCITYSNDSNLKQKNFFKRLLAVGYSPIQILPLFLHC